MNIAVSFIDAAAEQCAAKVAVIDRTREVTYGDTALLVSRAANGLRSLGCNKGDVILVLLPDSIEFIVAFFAAAKLGAVVVPLGVSLSSSAVAWHLIDTGATTVIAHANALVAVRAAVDDVGRAASVIVVAVDAEDAGSDLTWGNVLNSMRSACSAADVDAQQPVAYLYTSGSTSRPKAVVHSHGNFAAAARNVGIGVFGLDLSDVILSLSRLSFAFGLCFGMYCPFAARATTVLTDADRDLESIARLIVRRRPTFVAAVPSVLSGLLAASERWLSVDLSSVRSIASAGEPLSPRLLEAYQRRFRVKIVDGIGSTELLTHFISNRPDEIRPGTCGTPVPGCAVRLVDESGEEVPDDTPGMLWLQAETTCLGYLNKPELTGRIIVNGWITTGDLMSRDATGAYRFCGRQDDAIKVSGVWVNTHEVERLLCANSNVKRALVTAKEDPAGLRRLVAYVVRAPGASAEAAELLAHLAPRLPEHALPAAFVFVDSLPLLPSGKVERSALPSPSWPHPRISPAN